MKDYNQNKPSSYIQYLDANNLYGWAMSQKLPSHGFKWVDYDKNEVINLLEKRDTNKGYIFEVDLEYSKKLWNSHNDYPLAPEKIKVDNVEKLICSFKPLCITLSKFETISRRRHDSQKSTWRNKILSVKMDGTLYKKNTDLRKVATNTFEKDFFKLMNNSVVGKAIENIRKRQMLFWWITNI